MRDFFKKEVLARTYEIFGVRQTDEEKMSDDDIKFLLDGLCQVSKNYAYIPEEDQKNIIRACMLSDKTYRNINLRLVAGWLEQNGKKWFTELAHKETVIVHPPLEGEARDKMIQEALDAIAKVNLNFEAEKPKGNGARMREQLDAVAPRPPQTETSALEEACGVTEEMKKENTLEGNTDTPKT